MPGVLLAGRARRHLECHEWADRSSAWEAWQGAALLLGLPERRVRTVRLLACDRRRAGPGDETVFQPCLIGYFGRNPAL